VKHKRRPQGAGGLDALPSGKYRVRVRVNGRVVSQTLPTKVEAEAVLRAAAEQRLEAPPSPEATPPETVASWGVRWLARRRELSLVRHPRDDERRWAQYIEGTPLAAMELPAVKGRDVRAFLDGLLRRPKALDRQTITRVFALVRKCFADALADDLIPGNPCAGVAVPARAAVKGDPWTFLSAAEVDAVENCPDIPERTRLLFTAAIRTGLRAGELWALRWGDVVTDGATPKVTVRASHKSAPKNGRVQSVPLLPAAREAFERLRALADDTAPDALVFPSSTGAQRPRGDDARWSPESGGKGKPLRFVGYCAIAGITRPVRFHDLRHTFGSHLTMGTWTATPLPLAEVRALMRHGSIAMTERYSHVAPEHLSARIAAAPSARPAVAPSVPGASRPLPSAPSAPAGPSTALRGVTPAVTLDPPSSVSRGVMGRSETAGFPVGRVGIEPTTDGLKVREETSGFHGVPAVRDVPVTHSPPRGGDLQRFALDLLRAVDEGLPCAESARALAVEALRRMPPDSRGWNLALSIVDGGPLRARRAVDLAGLVLDEAAADVTPSAAHG